MYSIGLITAAGSLAHVMQINDEMQAKCNVTYLPYHSIDQLRQLYHENFNRFDAFLFSGSFPYDVICNDFGEVTKPCAYFNVSERDYYYLLLLAAAQNPGINFSRIAIDHPDIQVDLETIFGPGKGPLIFSIQSETDYINSMAEVYDVSYTYYKKLWDSGKVDLIFTRLSGLKEQLSEAGIRCYYISPSPVSMLETFNCLIMQLHSESVTNSSTVFGLVSPPKGIFNAKQMKELSHALLQCNKSFAMPFIIRQTDGRFELTTTASVFKELSCQHIVCPINEPVRSAVDFKFCVGWGSANNAVAAYHNAQRALRESSLSSDYPSFMVTADNMIIGPLSSQRRVIYTDYPSERIEALSQRLSLSPLNLRKLMSVLAQKGDNTLSTEELAYFLHVTTRTASRILCKLEDGGIATVSHHRQLNLRGRPAKIYKIDFGNL